MKLKILFQISILCCITATNATAKSNKISAGLGLMEIYNVGYDFQLKQSEIGINLGIWPSELNGFCLTGNYYYHFAGKSAYTPVKPWYIRAGLSLLWDKSNYSIAYNYFSTLRLGREINFSKRIGMGIDAGANYLTYRWEKVLEEDPCPTGNFMRISPSGSIKVYYRF